MAETVQGCTGDGESFLGSACLPEVCPLPQLSISKHASSSVKGKLISCKCIADLDSDSSCV